MQLTKVVEDDLSALARSFGDPVTVDAPISDHFDDPIRRTDRYGEVCMIVRRPTGKLLLSIKTFYPRGAYRLPTGGIHHDERVYDALLRETHEETGLEVEVRRFLARIAYRAADRPAPPLFHTFAFLLEETGGTLGALDASEQLEDWREIDVADLISVAEFLEDLRSSGARDIGGDWRAWGRFRAVVHRVVHGALTADIA
ncbi:MAG TPA: NUDIX hydrolase [Candidatus Limnocylindrales bacterium]|nr:NUDIX hydrolase [Candidatus Limnocylindrales bacterium]